MIEKRINRFSKSEKIFKKFVPIYQNALNDSNFKHKLKYSENKNPQTKKKRNRPRKIIYFNPPFCQSVKTNLGKIFFQLIDKHFKNNETLNKIINKNNCKISYSCMNNIKVIIQKHNKKTLNSILNKEKNKANDTPTCNCRSKNSCPLNNKCLIENVIYKATVISNKETMEYIGSTANTFKSRWYNHNHSFNTYKENSTELAKYIWFLKNNNIKYDIKWNIIHHIGEVRRIHNMCSTCNLEKLEIARASKRNNLNKRHELFANCPHLKKLHFKT